MSPQSLRSFVALVGGRMQGPQIAEAAPFRPSTDTRTIAPGETFVCLRGPNFDGHDFIAEAIQRGAVAIVADSAEKTAQARVPTILVDDAKGAYLEGAAEARRLSSARVIGVTGSNGKTTTKEFARQLLGRARRVLASPQNENNELGVARACYALSDDIDAAVIEMGARHPGEIAQLVAIAKPDIGILTNIGEAHLEFFEDQEQLAKTKFALFDKGALAVLSAGDEWSRTLAAQAAIEAASTWVRLTGDPHPQGLSLEAGTPSDGRVAVSFGASHAFAGWHMIGEQHLRDALLAAGAAIQCGMSFEETVTGFGDLHLPPGRFEMHSLLRGAVVVYDAYNASPTAVAHALHAFREIPAKRRIAVLGSMAELGPDSIRRHQETGAAAARASVDKLYCGGENAQALADGALQAGMARDAVMTYASNADVAALLLDELRDGDAVLLKGSRVQRMEQILDALLRGSKKDAVAS
jgi:UDP-N-acetylmuramoyl-tripeptide--D-alanyl-D-alanine ligase